MKRGRREGKEKEQRNERRIAAKRDGKEKEEEKGRVKEVKKMDGKRK